MKDIFGKALLDYHNGNYTEDIITSTSISTEDTLPLPYLFREFNNMPKIEQKALQLSKGNILDVGCGSGSHSLWLQQKGLHVKGIDISKGLKPPIWNNHGQVIGIAGVQLIHGKRAGGIVD